MQHSSQRKKTVQKPKPPQKLVGAFALRRHIAASHNRPQQPRQHQRSSTHRRRHSRSNQQMENPRTHPPNRTRPTRPTPIPTRRHHPSRTQNTPTKLANRLTCERRTMNELTPAQTQPFHDWLEDNGWRQTPIINSRTTTWHYTQQPKTTRIKIPKQPRADQIAAIAITIHKVIVQVRKQQTEQRRAG
jgi:hypothetical protein